MTAESIELRILKLLVRAVERSAHFQINLIVRSDSGGRPFSSCREIVDLTSAFCFHERRYRKARKQTSGSIFTFKIRRVAGPQQAPPDPPEAAESLNARHGVVGCGAAQDQCVGLERMRDSGRGIVRYADNKTMHIRWMREARRELPVPSDQGGHKCRGAGLEGSCGQRAVPCMLHVF